MNAPGSPGGLRVANREAVVRLLRTRGPMTQAELARASGLSPATISSLARELRDDGWLEDARELRLSRAAGVAVGIDFGHSHVRVAVADLGHEVLGEAQAPLDVDHEADEGIELAGRLVEQFGGRLVKTTGDGILATFDGPGRAIRCAAALRDELTGIDLQIRAGLHTGEIELREGDVGGIAVHIAARVMAAAAPGVILTSRTVRDLVVGSDIAMTDRGPHPLKGVDGTWQLFAASP